MKALGRLRELVAWRWAPAVGLCVASLFYVLVVVALVPDEIGVPVTNARFAKKVAPATAEVPEAPTFPTAVAESEMAPPPAPVRPAGVVDFGRRGFSPPLERPEAPPAPVMAPPPMPPAPPPVAVAPPEPATPPPAAPEMPGAVEPAANAEAAPVAAAQPTPAPNGIFRAIRSVLPNHQAPSNNAPAAPPGPPGPPGTPPAAPEAPPAAPDAK